MPRSCSETPSCLIKMSLSQVRFAQGHAALLPLRALSSPCPHLALLQVSSCPTCSSLLPHGCDPGLPLRAGTAIAAIRQQGAQHSCQCSGTMCPGDAGAGHRQASTQTHTASQRPHTCSERRSLNHVQPLLHGKNASVTLTQTDSPTFNSAEIRILQGTNLGPAHGGE